MNMQTTIVDPRRSILSLRRNGSMVAADTDIRGAVQVADAAMSAARMQGRMDAQGVLNYIGQRNQIGEMLTQANRHGYCRFDGEAQLNDIMRKLAAARIANPEGRLDDKSIGLTGSDRLDAVSPTAALALARELEYVTSEVLREERPVLSARRLFPVDSSIPAGAKSYVIRRIFSSGEMKFWKAGGTVPLVDVGRDEKSMTLAHAVIGIQNDFFESQADAYAGIGARSEKIRAARQAVDEFENIVFWNGAESHKLYGLLNFPWLTRRKLSSAITIPTSDAAYETLVALINDLFNDILDLNPGLGGGFRVIWSQRIGRRIAQSRHPSTQQSMLSRIQEDNPSITSIEEAAELQGTGPGSEDGILIVPTGQSGPTLVQPVSFSLLPVQTSNFGLTQTQAGYISIGGARYKEALRSTLVWADMS